MCLNVSLTKYNYTVWTQKYMKTIIKKEVHAPPSSRMSDRSNHVILLSQPHWYTQLTVCVLELTGWKPNLTAVP